MNFKTIISLIIISLIALNVYQYRNPQVIEVPGEQTAIDSTAWVQRSAYASRGSLLDSIEAENEKLADEVRKTRDDIANLTQINGKLNLQVDSMQVVNRLPLFENLQASDRSLKRSGLGRGQRLENPANYTGNASRFPAGTSYNFISVFGEGLFRVDSEVRFVTENLQASERSLNSSDERRLEESEKRGYAARTFIENNLDLTQLRDIEISVVNTMNDDRSRLLTYVTSEDFEELEYQTYTELKRTKRWPWFLIGVGVGVTGLAIVE